MKPDGANASDPPDACTRLDRESIDAIIGGADCVVIDFYGTLCSDPFWRPLGERALATIYQTLWLGDQALLNSWMSGQASAAEVCRRLSAPLGMPAGAVEEALRESCRAFVFNDAVWKFAQAARGAGKRTALVTVNMDVFSEEVAGSHHLDRVFETIVNSADHGHLDKRRLWPIAFQALAGDIGYANSFLIEDGDEGSAKFRAAGGGAYQYTDDEAFRTWIGGRRRG